MFQFEKYINLSQLILSSPRLLENSLKFSQKEEIQWPHARLKEYPYS